MENTDQPKDSRAHVKELLLEEYRYLTDAFWKNEQSGETRVNWLIGLVTAVAGGLAALASAEQGPKGELLGMIVIASLFALLVLGVITLFRILTRNKTTDQYKQACDAIRQMFRDRFDTDQILLQYYPFGRPKRGQRRKFGGLAHIVAGLNCLVFAVLVSSAVYPGSVTNATAVDFGPTYAAAAIAFFVGAILQFVYIGYRENASKDELRRDDPTHAGGVVFRLKPGSVQYLLVGPKREVANEWLLPKGHIKDEEGHGEAALREVQEETGVLARLIRLAGNVAFEAGKEKIRSKYYLMESLHEAKPAETRRTDWFTYDEALSLLTHDQNKLLLIQAEKLRTMREG